MHGRDVVCGLLVPIHAVSTRPLRKRRRMRLPGNRHADGVAVVLDEEHDRSLEYPCKVEGLVSIAFARRAVAEENNHREGVALEPGRIREANRVGDVRGERAALRGDPGRVGIVSGMPEAARVAEHLDWV